MRVSRLISILSLLPLAACGSDGAGSPDGGGESGADAAPGDGFTVTWGPVDVPAGTEHTQCVIKRLDNAGQIRVGKIENVLEATSHHFIVYQVNDDTVEERPEPFECQPFSDTLDPDKGAPLMVTQKSSEVLELPEGVGFTLEENQMVRLELHYINATQETQTAEASSTFHPMAEGDFQDEADFLFIGNPDIEIPPHQEWTLGPSYFPLPGDLEGVNFFAITGHEHQWGTDVYVESAPGESGDGTPVYDVENFNWDEPETVVHDPPFQVPSGGGFRFTCEWFNQSDDTVGFGESANDEMCFFWAYYYPSQGARVCVHSDEYNADICCPGSSLCSLLEGQF